MKHIIVILLTSIFIGANAQTPEKLEKVKIKDTITLTKYFIIKPFVFYNLYFRRAVCEGGAGYYINSSMTNTFINKYSYGLGTQLIRKVKKMQYGLSLKYIYSRENYGAKIIFSDGEDSVYTSNSQLAQLEIGLYVGREYKLNKIKIIPSVGLNYNRKIASNARFLVRDSKNLPNYKSIDINDLYSNYILTANVGCDVSFFHNRRLSPFVGYQYMKAFTKEAQEGIYNMKIVRHSNLFLLGLNYKM